VSGKSPTQGRSRRGLGLREMIEDLFDHGRIFDARLHLDRTTTMLAGQDVDLKYPLQTLRPRQNNC